MCSHASTISVCSLTYPASTLLLHTHRSFLLFKIISPGPSLLARLSWTHLSWTLSPCSAIEPSIASEDTDITGRDQDDENTGTKTIRGPNTSLSSLLPTTPPQAPETISRIQERRLRGRPKMEAIIIHTVVCQHNLSFFFIFRCGLGYIQGLKVYNMGEIGDNDGR